MPFRSILRAARMSRSLTAPHDGHTHVRSRNDSPLLMQPENKNKAFILGTRKTGCDLIVLGGTNCNEGSMDWLFGSLGNENFYVCQPASFYKSQQEIEKVNPLYAFKVATAYFRGQGLVPVFEDCHCRLIILRYGVG